MQRNRVVRKIFLIISSIDRRTSCTEMQYYCARVGSQGSEWRPGSTVLPNVPVCLQPEYPPINFGVKRVKIYAHHMFNSERRYNCETLYAR